MRSDPSYFLDKAGIHTPLIGFYDATDPSAFEPLVRPAEGQWACIFMFYKAWLQGKRLHLTSENYGCGGVENAFNLLDSPYFLFRLPSLTYHITIQTSVKTAKRA